ncbi:MAG: glycosyltransferase [Taibaiella sp.]|nr:glycosyltransferase [Taibaiella sp.]
MSQQVISIIIITYNREEDTLLLLKNMQQQNAYEAVVKEVLLLNNNSTTDYTGVEQYIKDNPQLKVIYFHHPENLGVARGRNFLIPKSTGDYLLVIDDDMEFDDPDSLLKLSTLLEKPKYVENKTVLITFGVFYFENLKRQINAFPHKKYEEYINKPWFLTYYFAGGAHIVRKDIFDTIGLYTENFFYGMEEYDLSYRILDRGFTIAYDDSVRILHKESPEGRLHNSNKLQMLWMNKSKVAWRYLPKKYFYSTVLFWSLQYLRRTKYDFSGWVKGLNKVMSIPKYEWRKPVSQKTLNYLKAHKARLYY